MIDMSAEIRYAKESPRLINFAEAFKDVARSLSRAYIVPNSFYEQPASMERFEKGISINSAKEFSDHATYDADKAAGIAVEIVGSRKLAKFGVTTSAEQLAGMSPDNKMATDRSLTMVVLLQRAARLEALLTPSSGIPEAYGTAQTQARLALNFVERAAKLACDWNPNWGKLTLKNVIAKARGTIDPQKVAQAAMLGVLALAGCDGVTVNFVTPDIATQGTAPTTTDVVPAMTETQALTSTVTIEPTLTETPTVTPTETATITPIETVAPTPAGIEMPFDTSNPETITATDGNQYEGYLMEDKYGTRLVDNANNILLVKDGDVWRLPESRNYSEAYPAVYYETKIGNTDGFEIPVTIGLSQNAQDGEDFNFTEVHMTQKGADDIAQVYLQDCWLRYKYVMNHPDVTYDQYLDLLKQGKGDIAIYDILAKKEFLIDPRQGFSLVLTADGPGTMPLKYQYNSASGFYYGADETGRLMRAENQAWIYHLNLQGDTSYFRDINTVFLIGALTTSSDLAIYSDACLAHGVLAECGIPNPLSDPLASDIENSTQHLADDFQAFNSYTSDDPLFTLK